MQLRRAMVSSLSCLGDISYGRASAITSWHSGSAYLEGGVSWATARLRYPAAYRADHARRAAGRTRSAVSGAIAARTSGFAGFRMGDFGQQSARQVLSTHSDRPQAAA